MDKLDQLETFAFADDREDCVKRLTPGSSEYFTLNLVHLQNKSAGHPSTEFDELLAEAKFERREGRAHPEYLDELKWRQKFLEFEALQSDKQAEVLSEIQKRTRVNLDHAREVKSTFAEEKQMYPSELDESIISTENVLKSSFAQHGCANITKLGHRWLALQDLDDSALERFLATCEPVTNIVELLVKHYGKSKQRRFFNVCQKLTLRQLDELFEKTDVLQSYEFVNIYIAKLAPPDYIDLTLDQDANTVYLKKSRKFVQRLDPVHNSVKACVYYHWLKLLEETNNYSLDALVDYLELERPRAVYTPRRGSAGFPAQPNVSVQVRFDAGAGIGKHALGAIGTGDLGVVENHVAHFLKIGKPIATFSKFCDESWLRRLHAEQRLLCWSDDDKKNSEEYFKVLGGAQNVARFRDRVDIDLASFNPKTFSVDEEVALNVFIKNVPRLVVKIFEINTLAYFRKHRSALTTDLNLDGLAPQHEVTFRFDSPDTDFSPFRREGRRIPLPQIPPRRGVYMVDLVGAGTSARAVICKGALRYTLRQGVAGQVFSLFNEADEPIQKGEIHLGGRVFSSQDNGKVYVPYSTSNTKTEKVILVDTESGFASFAEFEHQTESYDLSCGFYVDRESLLSKERATVLIRAVLRLQDTVVTLATLSGATLVVNCEDSAGVRTTSTIENLVLTDDEETIYSFTVPANLKSLEFSVEAKVKNVSMSREETLQSSKSFRLNEIDESDKLQDCFLSFDSDGYAVSVLGKSGEPRPGAAAALTFDHTYVRSGTLPRVILETDQSGRIRLGKLKNVERLHFHVEGGTRTITWNLSDGSTCTQEKRMHFRTGELIRVPLSKWDDDDVTLSLFDRNYASDFSEKIVVQNGFIEIVDLDAGDYVLIDLRNNFPIELSVSDGKNLGSDYISDKSRLLQVRPDPPVNIVSVEASQQEGCRIQLANFTSAARVHVLATHFAPPARALVSSLGELGQPGAELATVNVSAPRSEYLRQRVISEEYRYILERRQAKKFIGNMLQRPGLLLEPWSHSTTSTETQHAKKGGAYGRQAMGGGGAFGSAAPGGWGNAGAAPDISDFNQWSNLDFLRGQSTLLANLKPDSDTGVVTISPSDLGADHMTLTVLAVDSGGACERTVDTGLRTNDLGEYRDVRLFPGLNLNYHFKEQRKVSLLLPGDSTEIEDIKTSEFETYENVESLVRLFKALSVESTKVSELLAEFSFISRWNELDEETQLAKYDKYASHELNFYLFHRDSQFFANVIMPYIANKSHKSFMDFYFVQDRDGMKQFLDPYAFSQLNALEKILLASSLPQSGRGDAILRSFRDQCDAIVEDPVKLDRLFKTALRAKSMDSPGESLDMAEEKLPGGDEMEFAMAEETGEARLYDCADSPPRRAARARVSKSRQPNLRSSGVAFGYAQRSRGGKAQQEDLKQRDSCVGQMYQATDVTKEFEETYYYKVPWVEQSPSLVPVSKFWNDYAGYVLEKRRGPFLSEHFLGATNSFTEVMFVLAVLSVTHQPVETFEKFSQEARVSIRAKSPVIVFSQELLSADPPDSSSVLITQNYFDPTEPRVRVDGEWQQKFVTGEMLRVRAYGCLVTVTNTTSARMRLKALLQVPQGAVAIRGGSLTRPDHDLGLLNGYETRVVEYFFYFPRSGTFRHYPVHVTCKGKLVGFGEPSTVKVVDAFTEVDLSSWRYVAQEGTSDQVLDFLNAKNLLELDLSQMFWRLKEKAFFLKTTNLLRERDHFDQDIWAYALKHNSVRELGVFLSNSSKVSNLVGPFKLDSSVLKYDPFVRRSYQHLEYAPLINARAHTLGARRKILNDGFRAQYTRFLWQVCMLAVQRKADLPPTLLLEMTYYLLLQDRIEEAIEMFKSVKCSPNGVATQIQYDYMRAYLSFFNEDGNLGEAREITSKYRNMKIPKKRKLFEDLEKHMSDYEYKSDVPSDPTQAGIHTYLGDRQRAMSERAAHAPSLEVEGADGGVVVTWLNLTNLKVNFYEMDLELLFSSSPFMKDAGSAFSVVSPNHTMSMDLVSSVVPGRGSQVPQQSTIRIPEPLRTANLYIEVIGVGTGVVKSLTYYANQLRVQVMESYGHLAVFSRSESPIGKAYIKVYSRLKDGSIAFYKDGYTDCRGMFDYASISTDQLTRTQKFAILVITDKLGSVVRESDPPQQ
eukprot:199050_1